VADLENEPNSSFLGSATPAQTERGVAASSKCLPVRMRTAHEPQGLQSIPQERCQEAALSSPAPTALNVRKAESADSTPVQKALKPFHDADEPDICVVTSLQEVAFWRGTPYCWPMPLGGHEHIACSRAYLDELSKQHPDLINVTVKGSHGANFDEVRIPGSLSQSSASGCNAAFR